MSAPRRAPRRKLDGVLLLDKPLGITSNTALQIARRLLNAEKAGHTGTLDPLATGLLPLCFGEATKFAGELLDADKAYEATLKLGQTTTTADAEGEVLQTRPVEVTRATLDAALQAHLGVIQQVPPMYSALKRDGKPLYEYARAGVELEREARTVTIHGIKLIEWNGDSVRIAVDCSKGTYIRTLAEDIGETLGCGAHLSALRRTRIADITLENSITLADLEVAVDRDAALLPAEALLKELPAAQLDSQGSQRMLHGQSVQWPAAAETAVGQRFRAYTDDGRFIGLCQLDTEGYLAPKRLVAL
ncbi:MAG TPA: tRNA pseudouridine(55) synthase TruB [Rhodocyclaceae bacterium]|jgi:tRNA pseudouridine55 synthase|nr:tRNA pseudouridine(55) synthase TruB [Rhodocyclaceae bacterium]